MRVEQFQRSAATTGDAGERIVRHLHMQPGFLAQQTVEIAQQRAATLLNFIPLFMVLAAFTGGMHIATDSTAGERERGSMEPLLVTPARRGVIAAGKWLAASASSPPMA